MVKKAIFHKNLPNFAIQKNISYIKVHIKRRAIIKTANTMYGTASMSGFLHSKITGQTVTVNKTQIKAPNNGSLCINIDDKNICKMA